MKWEPCRRNHGSLMESIGNKVQDLKETAYEGKQQCKNSLINLFSPDDQYDVMPEGSFTSPEYMEWLCGSGWQSNNKWGVPKLKNQLRENTSSHTDTGDQCMILLTALTLSTSEMKRSMNIILNDE